MGCSVKKTPTESLGRGGGGARKSILSNGVIVYKGTVAKGGFHSTDISQFGPFVLHQSKLTECLIRFSKEITSDGRPTGK